MKFTKLTIFIICSSINVNGQNLFNTYNGELNAQPIIPTTYYQQHVPPDNFSFDYSPYKPYANSPYNGEYEINIEDLFWYRDFPNATISYDMEIVSFPFTLNCAYLTNGCADPNGTPTPTQRELSMPNVAYNVSVRPIHVVKLIDSNLVCSKHSKCKRSNNIKQKQSGLVTWSHGSNRG